MKLKSSKSSTRFTFNIGNSTIMLARYKRPENVTVGISNITFDRRYVPFVDYDNVNYLDVVREAEKLISMFNLTCLAIIKTKETLSPTRELYGNYHLVGIDKLSFHDHIRLLENTNCDPSYIHVPKIYRGRYWVLRIYPKINIHDWIESHDKPELADFIYGHKSPYIHSTAHYEFLSKFYKTPSVELNGDDSTKLKLVHYIT